MFLLLAGVGGAVAAAVGSAPLPPGVDPGHWLSASYPYAGLPTAPEPANQPGVYSPLMFPMLGALVLATGSPPAAAAIFGVGVFVAFGATVVHLARRYLRIGVLQVGLVGGAIGCGTILQMVFWGAYPNLLGFLLLNETMVFFLLFVREGRTRDSVLFYASIGLTYLAHDLTFFLTLAALAGALTFLWLTRQVSPRFLLDRRNVIGGVALAALVGGYGAITSRLGVTHPSYFYSNPAAYPVDEIGEFFLPLGRYPAFTPATGPLVLDPSATTVLLLLVPLALLGLLVLVRRRSPTAVSIPITIAAGWLGAVAAVPALGWLAHVDTDYERFLYFLPLPLILFSALGAEQLAVRWSPSIGRAIGLDRDARENRDGRPRFARRSAGARWVPASITAVLLFLLFATVTAPAIATGEASGTYGGHDAAFLAAAGWLNGAPVGGNVLTTTTAARWTEALTDRSSYTAGPVWLEFDPFQIALAEESYWALNSETVLAGGPGVLSFSGFETSALSQAPMYSVYDDGVPFPMFRVLPGACSVTVTVGGSTFTSSLTGNATPSETWPSNAGDPAGITYRTTYATVSESASIDQAGHAAIRFAVAPSGGSVVRSFTLALAAPPGGSPQLARDRVTAIAYADGQLTWTVQGSLGQYPYPVSVGASALMQPAPSNTSTGTFQGAPEWKAVFPATSGSLDLWFNASAGATQIPTDAVPPVFRSAEFFAAHDIHFILWPAGKYSGSQAYYFQMAFGFRQVFANSEWVIYEA